MRSLRMVYGFAITFVTLIFTLAGTPLTTLLGQTGNDPLGAWKASLSPITGENASQITALAYFGGGTIDEVKVSPDGKTLAVTGALGVRLYDSAHPDHVLQLLTSKAHVDCNAMAFSPAAPLLAYGCYDGTIHMWSMQTSTELAVLTQPATEQFPEIYNLSFSANGKALVSRNRTGNMYVWDSAGKAAGLLGGGPGAGLAVSPDGSRAAYGTSVDNGTPTRANVIKVLDVKNGAEVMTLQGLPDEVHTLAFSPDGKELAAAGKDGAVRLWDTARWRLQATLTGHVGWVFTLSFDAKGARLLSGGADGATRLWDLNLKTAQTYQGFDTEVFGAALSPDGKTLVTSGSDGAVRLWDTAIRAATTQISVGTPGLNRVVTTNDGKWVATGDDMGWIQILDGVTGNRVATLQESTAPILGLAFSPNGTTLVSCTAQNVLRFWDISTKSKILTVPFPCVRDYADTLAFSPDGSKLAVTDGQVVYLLDPKTGATLTTLKDQSRLPHALAYSPDGSAIAALTQHGVDLWDVATGQLIGSFGDFLLGPQSVRFSHDGKTIAFASYDNRVELWDAKTRKQISVLTGYKAGVRTIAFSADDMLLISGGADKQISIWDWRTQTLLAALAGHTDQVNSILLRNDGRLLLSASSDGTLRLWGIGIH